MSGSSRHMLPLRFMVDGTTLNVCVSERRREKEKE